MISNGPLGFLDFSVLNHNLKQNSIQKPSEEKQNVAKPKKSNYKSSALPNLSLRDQVLFQNAHLIEKSNASLRSAIIHTNVEQAPNKPEKGLLYHTF
jgi:hypothetical protein